MQPSVTSSATRLPWKTTGVWARSPRRDWPASGPEHELPVLGEEDARPRAAAALDEDGDDGAEDVVGVAAAVEDAVDGLQGGGAHRLKPSKSEIRVRKTSGTGTVLRSSWSINTTVWSAVTIRTSSPPSSSR